MGIDFSHCTAQWSYFGFHHFRKRLAKDIGIELVEMAGFTERGVEGLAWPDAEDEPVVHLLNHSDADGELSPEQCAAVVPRLREIASAWPVTGNHDVDYDRTNALLLAEGMELVASKGESLEFR